MQYNNVGRYYNLTYKSFSPNHPCIDCVTCQLCNFLLLKIRLEDFAYTSWIRVYSGKLVNAPKSHKIVYAPMHKIHVITRLVQNARRTDLTLASSRLCFDYTSASISFQQCSSSSNNPHYAPWRITYYYFFLMLLYYIFNVATG